MAKKLPRKAADANIKIRCRAEDVESFRDASEREGFGGNLTAWMLYHLRRIARERGDAS